jgi:exopolyphosphatase/guanosine-5'-triphosphate,3'-diphosphate pyrophosphatase
MSAPLYAVIDLGTNTFHLLIARRREDEQIEDVYRERRFIRLAEDGIATIGPAPYQRALACLQDFRLIIDEHGLPVERVLAFGTAGMRTASNGAQLIKEVAERTGIRIRLIDGDEEARLIYRGISLAVPPSPSYQLMMDIGGGSVEFIIANQDGVQWAQSFPVGVAVLFRDFHHTEPIAEEEVVALEAFLRKTLAPVKAALDGNPCEDLIGASGTFDILEQFIGEQRSNGLHYAEVPLHAFPAFCQQILSMNKAERHALPHMPKTRAEMLVVALVLVDVVMKLAGTKRIIVSDYALKEGMIREMEA